jgi:methionyl aminopeptidase
MLEGHVRAGVTTLELDKLADEYIRSKGGEPCFKNYNGFKYSICTSINSESIHGMPSKKALREGDIISIDCGVRYPKGDGMCTDAARTFPVGRVTDKAQNLIDACEKSNTIGKRIEKFIDGRYGIISCYFGHGIGKKIHEGVLIPNFDVDKNGILPKVAQMAEKVLEEGMIICIEPMINCGKKDVKVLKDGWTVATVDGQLSAHYENTMIITKDGVEIVT